MTEDRITPLLQAIRAEQQIQDIKADNDDFQVTLDWCDSLGQAIAEKDSNKFAQLRGGSQEESYSTARNFLTYVTGYVCLSGNSVTAPQLPNSGVPIPESIALPIGEAYQKAYQLEDTIFQQVIRLYPEVQAACLEVLKKSIARTDLRTVVWTGMKTLTREQKKALLQQIDQEEIKHWFYPENDQLLQQYGKVLMEIRQKLMILGQYFGWNPSSESEG